MSVDTHTLGDLSKDCVIITGCFKAYMYETYVGLAAGEPLFTFSESADKAISGTKRRKYQKSLPYATSCSRFKSRDDAVKFAGIAVSIFSRPFSAYSDPEKALVSLAIAGKIRTHVRDTSVESHIGTCIYAVFDTTGNYLTVLHKPGSVAIGVILGWHYRNLVDIFITFNPDV